MIRFSFFTGDRNFLRYGGKWLSNEQEFEGERYFLGIELINWEEAQGEPGPGGTTYNLSLSIIPHPLEVSPDRLRQVLESCGPMAEEPSIEAMIDALWGYGISCPVEEVNTNNWREGMRQLRWAAREMDYRGAMDEKPVNKIGSTGREYLSGDFLAAVARGLQEGRKDAWLMARIQGVTEEELEAEGFRSPFKKQD